LAASGTESLVHAFEADPAITATFCWKLFRDRAQWRPGAVGGEPRYPEWFGEDFDALLELLRAGKIHPVVAERLPLAEARHAHELLETSASKGNWSWCQKAGDKYGRHADRGLPPGPPRRCRRPECRAA
jgi:hypothetical protein